MSQPDDANLHAVIEAARTRRAPRPPFSPRDLLAFVAGFLAGNAEAAESDVGNALLHAGFGARSWDRARALLEETAAARERRFVNVWMR